MSVYHFYGAESADIQDSKRSGAPKPARQD